MKLELVKSNLLDHMILGRMATRSKASASTSSSTSSDSTDPVGTRKSVKKVKLDTELTSLQAIQMGKPYPLSVDVSIIPDCRVWNEQVESYFKNLPLTLETIIPMPKFHYGVFPGADQGYCFPIMYRPWMKATIVEMRQMIDGFKHDADDRRSFALAGPQGIGKSHCLYLLAAILKQNPNQMKYRVWYLPTCSELSVVDPSSNRTTILSSLKLAFPDQDLSVQAILTQFETDKNFSLESALIKLNIYYDENQVQVVLIFDQLNSIAEQDYMIKIKNFLEKIRKVIPTIVSYSADSNFEVKDTVYNVYQAKNYEIQNDEALAFCKLFLPNITPSEVEDVVDLTGRTPLEISLCLKNEGMDMEERLQEYSNTRYIEYTTGFNKFLEEKKSDYSRKKTVSTMIRMLISSSYKFPVYSSWYDQKLIQFKVIDAKMKYEFINNIAWRAVFETLYENLEDNVDTEASAIILSDRTNSIVGFEIERYIILRSLAAGSFSIGESNEDSLQIPFKIHRQFGIQDSLNLSDSCFYYPNISTFPGFDFLVYERDSKRGHLYMVKVTMEEESTSHRDKVKQFMDDPSSKLSVFMARIVASLPKAESLCVYEIYLVKGKPIGKVVSKNGYNEIPLSMLSDYYVALKSLY